MTTGRLSLTNGMPVHTSKKGIKDLLYGIYIMYWLKIENRIIYPASSVMFFAASNMDDERMFFCEVS